MTSCVKLLKALRTACSLTSYTPAREQRHSFSLSACLHTLGCNSISNDSLAYRTEYSRQEGNPAPVYLSRRCTSKVHAATGLHAIGAACLLGHPSWRGYSAHAAVLAKENEQENPGFVAGKFDVQQFPPERVSSDLPRPRPKTCMIRCIK